MLYQRDRPPQKLFTKLVTATRARREAFAARLRRLFGTMRDGGFFGVDDPRQLL